MAATSRFSISGTISMFDKSMAGFSSATKNAQKFTGTMQRQMSRAEMASKKFNGQLQRVSSIGLASVGLGAGYAAREFVQFDDAIFGAVAKFGDLDITTKKGQKTMEQLRQTARKVGAETKFSATQAAQGLDFLAMAGFNTEQSMKLLPNVANLATVANVDLARATDIASDAIGSFGMMTDDTAQLSKNFARIQDVMAKTVTKTNTNMEDLFETIKFGAPPFTAAGQSMETFNAIAGRMASSGIKGSRSGTALRSAILRLQKPTKEVSDGLRMFGLSTSDIIKDGKLMDMVDIMALWEKNGKKMTTQQRNAALTMIVGKNAVSGWAAVMNEGVGQTQKLKKALEDSTGTSKKMADIIKQSLGNQLKALGSAALEATFVIFSAFSGKGKSGIETLTDAVRTFGKTIAFLMPVLKVLLYSFILWKIYLIAIMVQQKAMIAIGWIKYLFMMRGAILLAVTGHWLEIKALIVKNGLFIKSVAAMLVAKGAMIATAVATKVVTAATWLFNAALLANPIVWVVIAIIALIAAIVLLVKNWDTVKQVMLDVWDIMTNKVANAIMFVKGIFYDFVFGFTYVWFKIIDAVLAGVEKIGGVLGLNVAKISQMRQEASDLQAGIQAKGIVSSQFASPESRNIVNTNNNTTTTNGRVDINVNAPKTTTTEQTGTLPQGMVLNTGAG
jgi:TP901 family phage tail tape measure protein